MIETTISALNPVVGKVIPVEGPSGLRVNHAGGLVFVGGQISAGPTGEVIGAGDLTLQLKNVFENIGRVLRDGEVTWSDVVRMDVFYVAEKGAEDFWARLSAVAKEFLGGSGPVWTGVQVPGLAYPGLLVEIDAVAVVRRT